MTGKDAQRIQYLKSELVDWKKLKMDGKADGLKKAVKDHVAEMEKELAALQKPQE